MPKRTTDYHTTLLEDLSDPEEAATYLTAALSESEDMFLIALRDIAEAHQMSKVAAAAGVSRESLYRMLDKAGNPTSRNLFSILRALGVTTGFHAHGMKLAHSAHHHPDGLPQTRAARASRRGANKPKPRTGQHSALVIESSYALIENLGATLPHKIENGYVHSISVALNNNTSAVINCAVGLQDIGANNAALQESGDRTSAYADMVDSAKGTMYAGNRGIAQHA